jgi:multidrug efflux pump subunit AcrA (membrane-fusion protein)
MSNPQSQPDGGQSANQQGAAQQQQQQPAPAAVAQQQAAAAQEAAAQQAAAAQQPALLQQNAALQQQLALLQQQLQQQQAQAAQPIRMKELKLPEPKVYQGMTDKTPIRMWLKDVEEIFIIGGIPPDHRTAIVYAAHYLAKEPKTWYKMHEASITTWQAFKDCLISRYKDIREVDKLRQKLTNMRQLSSVEVYTTAFDKTTLELTEAAGYAPRDDELMFLYREGLKKDIRAIVRTMGAAQYSNYNKQLV